MDFLELAEGPAEGITLTDPFWTSFGIGLLMMLVAEIGDKTFLCAATLGMNKDLFPTIAGVQATMALMIPASIVSGSAIADVASAALVNIASIICFGLFFVMFVLEAWRYQEPPPDSMHDNLIEYPRVPDDPGMSMNPPTDKHPRLTAWFDVFWRMAVLAFFAEWADRTQFSLFTLSKDYEHSGLGMGSWIGQGICTTVAVFAARYVTEKIPAKKRLYLGSVVFLVLGLYVYFWKPNKKFAGMK